MGVYVYKARKSRPLSVVFQGKKIQAYRYVYLSRLSSYELDNYPSLKRIEGRIDGAWGEAKPEYGVEIEKPSEETFGWLYGNLKSITWFDCDNLGEQVGCVYRNTKNRWASMPIKEFYATLKRVTGFEEKELWQATGVVLDETTEEGCMLGHYIRHHGFRKLKIISPDEARAIENIVI